MSCTDCGHERSDHYGGRMSGCMLCRCDRFRESPLCGQGASKRTRHWFTRRGYVGDYQATCVRCGAPNPRFRAEGETDGK